jgi:hypothetical protein
MMTLTWALDDLGKQGNAWPEMAKEANEQTIIQWIMDGQFKRPLHVIVFNTFEGWSRDVTERITWKILELKSSRNAIRRSSERVCKIGAYVRF